MSRFERGAKSNFTIFINVCWGPQMKTQKSEAISIPKYYTTEVHSTHEGNAPYKIHKSRDRMHSRKQLRKLSFFFSFFPVNSAIICFRLCHMAMTFILKRSAVFLPYVAHNLHSFGQPIRHSVFNHFVVVSVLPCYCIALCFFSFFVIKLNSEMMILTAVRRRLCQWKCENKFP